MSLTSIPINFKEVFTTNVRTIHINPHWTVTQFIESVRPIIEQEYHLENDDFDIVPTGQDSPGIPAEAGFPLQMSDISLRNMWGKELHVAFYIRRRNHIYPQLQNLNANIHVDPEINPIITNSAIVNDCPVCLETVPLLNRYSCRHVICTDCYYRCLNREYNTCPLCRSL